MYADSSLLGLIPARGGSKGLPKKNILNCAGKPLIEWTIAAALGVDQIDDVVVTTDDEEIARAARCAGASVPLLRPSALAADDSSILDVIRHAWESRLDGKGRRFDYIVLLQPTSPLRTSIHVRDAIELYFRNRSSEEDSLASVYQVSQKFGWLMQVGVCGRYAHFCLDVSTRNPQRQNLAPYLLPNGAIFIVKASTLEAGLYRKNTLPFLMSINDSVDVDTYEDFNEAEIRLRQREQENKV
jgi:CMP-N,N'-diacetyllegionaminic acid synthase